jgi:hypothetical protein
VWHTLATFAIAMPLLPLLHLWAIGLGVLVACVIEAYVLGRQAAKTSGARMLRPLLGPLAAGTVAATGGWLVASMLGPHLLAAVASGGLALGAYLLLALVVPGNMVIATGREMRRALRATR